MKKYNRPEIETLALETVDVIAVSSSGGTRTALDEALANGDSLQSYNVTDFGEQISKLNSYYTW